MARDLGWTVPVMRAGYAGRGTVYLVVAGFSLYALTYGGRAEGTTSALAKLEGTTWGGLVLFLIFLGMLAYALWRWVDGIYDLDDHGSDGSGWFARAALIVTGTINLGIGAAAFLLLFGPVGGADAGGGGRSTITRGIDMLMDWPAGRWLVGLVGAVILGAGVYHGVKAWKESYRDHLRASAFTTRWNWVLKAGVLARGVVLAIIGGLVLVAAWQHDPSAAGGVREAFGWLHAQAYGRVLVAAVCVGLLAFAVFCFVNSAYRIVPKVAGDDIETLAAWMRRKAERAAS